MLVTEVRRTQLRRAQFGCLEHPEQRPPDEDVGVHDGMTHARSQHAQVITDKTHVVGERHPAEARVIFGPFKALDDCADVHAKIGMRQANTFRVTRRTGRVLDECDVLRRCRVDLAVLTRCRIVHQRRPRLENRGDVIHSLRLREIEQPLQQVHLGEQRAALELAQNPEQLVSVLVTDADGHRHRHDAAQHGGPVRDDEIQIRAAENDQFVPGPHAAGLE